LDVSLKIYKEVIPAAGSVNSAVRISPEKMADITQAEWVDVCQ
jgi:prolyl-tRNA editing enzyme YbaK/EbsC (Cys-tRNA(Pro) deacylase)